MSVQLTHPYIPLQIGPLAPNTTPIFWGHGHADPYLRANLATQGVFALRRAPFALDDIEYRVRGRADFTPTPNIP